MEGDNVNQKMLHEKMMMDPAISLVLFNEYIPLQQPKKHNETRKEEVAEKKLCKEMGGLFLGKLEEEEKPKKIDNETVSDENGLFIRSEPDTTGGLFIRSEDSSVTDDWVIA